ncbi:hypothetical protein [Nesterenkonia sp. NBAIMH1]|uniref:hypothetical protein n=1 Tax=Nesterenkonia sp. NBAIMH1 TaxID=2600320 RepID=UPI0011B736F7|nr:hypothetical protein [Nesterenkonia sp. NBAIMH1]
MASMSIIPSGGYDPQDHPPVPSRSPSTKQGAGSVLRSAAGGYAAAKGLSMVSRKTFSEDGRLTPTAEEWLTRAVTVQRPVVLANLRRLRKAHPTHTNRQLAHELDREFKRTLTGSGAAIGATAAVPGVGTAAALGISAAATGGFLELCALYAQSMAELSGITTEDPQKAKLLVMGVMLGDDGRKLLAELNAQAGGKGAGPISSMVPLSSWGSASAGSSTMGNLVANQLKRQFLKRFFVRQGSSMFARAIPFGIGAAVGGLGNRALGSRVIDSAHKTFGELPEGTPAALVADFRRGLERDKHRAERRERRQRRKALKAEGRSERAQRRALRAAEAESDDEDGQELREVGS